MPNQAYSKISTEDMETSLPTNVSDTLHTSSFSHIEEARRLTWRDTFYEGKHGIVAVFDRDTEAAGDFLMGRFVAWAIVFLLLSFMYWLLSETEDAANMDLVIFDDIEAVYLLLIAVLFAFLGWRSKQAMDIQHIALTTEGVRVDNGPISSVTIPFEHIHSCTTTRQTYFCRLMSAKFLTVIIHRTAMPLDMEKLCCSKTKKLEILGVVRAEEFVELVMAMKDSEQNGTYEAANPGMELSSFGGSPATAAATTTNVE